MEEILASIRRIISDDSASAEAAKPAPAKSRDAGPAPAPAEPAMSQETIDALLSKSEPTPAAPEPGVLELTEAIEQPAAPRAIEAADIVFRENEEASPAPNLVPPALQERRDEALMSEQTTAAVSAAFDSLANTFFSQNSRTIEDLVREMLRPMLKHWIDDNLPGLVERMVRAEIERVSRGGR
jgi:cell pole-organizing protein PopZ